jgi:hypothetical protein
MKSLNRPFCRDKTDKWRDGTEQSGARVVSRNNFKRNAQFLHFFNGGLTNGKDKRQLRKQVHFYDSNIGYKPFGGK